MKNYLITGAAGYIGLSLVKYISAAGKEAVITAVVRNGDSASRVLPDGVTVIAADLSDAGAAAGISGSFDFIIHCAAMTGSLEMKEHPVEVIQSIINGTQNVMELARRCAPKSVVVLSSMEVYGVMDCSGGRRAAEAEAACGAVELLSARSCYPLGKRMAENICYSYFKEYGVPVKIARPALTFGRGIRPSDRRIYAQFARSVKEGADLVLHTDGSSMGNYCSIDDTVTGILTILEHGTDGEAYNVVNEENTMTIRQMAELVADRIAGGRVRVVCDIPEEDRYGYAACTGLRLSGKKLMALGWQPKKNLEEMYRDMLETL